MGGGQSSGVAASRRLTGYWQEDAGKCRVCPPVALSACVIYLGTLGRMAAAWSTSGAEIMVDTAPGKDCECSKAACPHAGLLTNCNSLPGAMLDPELAAFARPAAISSWPESSPRSATVKARTAALKAE